MPKAAENIALWTADLEIALRDQLVSNKSFLEPATEVDGKPDERPLVPCWMDVLQSLSRQPAPLPQALGVVRFISVPKGSIPLEPVDPDSSLLVAAIFDLAAFQARYPIALADFELKTA